MNVHVLDLFCGGGGSGLAMARLGLEPLGVDRDESALEIYRQATARDENLSGVLTKNLVV